MKSRMGGKNGRNREGCSACAGLVILRWLAASYQWLPSFNREFRLATPFFLGSPAL
jgi:hypothetical protein